MPSNADALEARTMRRVTLRIVPFLMVCYFISFLDRVNLGFAALEMVEDLHFSATVFGFGAGIFFVSYFLFEVPSNLLLEKFGARRWIARIMITWGVLAAAMALVTGPRSLYLVRFLLGAAEAGFFPGVILYLTYWFPSEYRARIVGLFTVAIPISSLLGSPLSAALLATDGWFGLSGWQWMFIIEAAPAVLLGLACLAVLSDGPADARWLAADERAWLLTKLQAQAGQQRPVAQLSLWQVLWNKHVLVLSVVLAGSTAVSSGLQLWQPQIIKSYGLTNMQTGMLNAIPFALASVIMIWWGNRSDRTGERIWHASGPLMLTAVSLASALAFTSLFAIVVILCLAVIGIYAGKGPVWAVSTEWLSAGTAAAGLAQINAISNLAGFATTYVMGFIKDATGSFSLALVPLVALAATGAVAIVWIGRGQRLAARAVAFTLACLILNRDLSAQLVTTANLENAAADNSSWLTYGRDYYGQRFVRLDQITPRNVSRLRPAWVFATGGDNRGLQATPLIHNGVIYLSADQSRVFAIDARTGQKKWAYDPKIGNDVERVYCCGSINRGVALWGDLVFVGTMDARMIALDRETGAVRWETPVIDWRQGYSITGAPLVVKDMVLTGVAGGEFGIRGFVKAFDARSGTPRWTAYTIPGPGEPGHDTWPGDTWRNGGGPTWTTGVFDPQLGLVYWNTGNAAPWNCRVREGDNKWTASTIAIDADSGAIRWGYQYTPHDCWDYDAVSTPLLADVVDIVPGERGPMKALFHHDKNGFFYALDRTNGRFVYAEPIVPGINWTLGLDKETGRPRVNPDMIAASGGPEVGPIVPSLEGAIDWQPLAFNPSLGLLYFMSNQWAMGFKFWAEEKFAPPSNGEWYLGADYQQYLTSDHPGNFVAFDVVHRKVRWRAVSPAPFWAGAVATSSGLVFTGDMRGYVMALDARTGAILWQFQTGSGIIGSPITYELDGRQYLAIPSGGIGGDMTFYYKEPKAGNLWVFALDGGPARNPTTTETNLTTRLGALPKVGEPGATLGGRVLPGYGFPATEGKAPIQGEAPPQPTAATASATPAANQSAINTGERLYRGRCVGCHQAGGASGPNIFRTALSETAFAAVVAKGRPGTLMPAFESILTPEEIRAIDAFVRSRDRLQ